MARTADELVTAPRAETADNDRERFTHIVLEGFTPQGAGFVGVGNSVVEGMINDTPVRALCGKVWVPRNDPARFPLCPTCREVAEHLGWRVPA